MVTDDEYVTEIREVRRRKDTQRSKSSKSTEFESDLLRNKATKNVAGPTESRPFDTDAFRQQVRDEVTAELADAESAFGYDSFDSEAPTPITVEKRDLPPGWQALADALADAAVEVTTALTREVVAPFLRDVALPAAKAKFHEVRTRRRVRAVERTVAKAQAFGDRPSEVAEEPEVTGLSSTEVETAEPLVRMSRSEYVRIQLGLRLAEDYAARSRWLLAQADVEDEDLTPELERSITLMLEGRAHELNDDERAAVAAFLQGSENPSDVRHAIEIERAGKGHE